MIEIASFVFFDIETTGLPWQEKNRTKITELCFVAAMRKDIENTFLGNTPVLNKLTLVFNPQKEIDPEVTHLNGLTNDLLRYTPIFGRKIKTIISFLEELPKPVCLVAHNGNVFDFKILLAECIDAGVTLPSDLLCVDSLVGFRTLLKGTTISYNTLQSQTFYNDFLTEDEDDWPDLNLSVDEWQEIDELCLSLSDISCEDLPQTEPTGNKSKIRQLSKTKKSSKSLKRNEHNKKLKAAKECYNLSTLYKRLLNKEEANVHRAETDCLMLLACVVALKSEFLPWADTACQALSNIKPLIRY